METENNQGIDISKDNQSSNALKRDEKGRLVKGTPPGPGRPKGQTLKEYQASKYREMPDEKKEEELKTMSPELKWRMAEGNPRQDTDITSGGEPIQPLFDYVANRNNNSNREDTKPDEKN